MIRTVKTAYEYSPPNPKPDFFNPQLLQKTMIDDHSPSDLASKIIMNQSAEKEKSIEESNLKSSSLKNFNKFFYHLKKAMWKSKFQ